MFDFLKLLDINSRMQERTGNDNKKKPETDVETFEKGKDWIRDYGKETKWNKEHSVWEVKWLDDFNERGM